MPTRAIHTLPAPGQPPSPVRGRRLPRRVGGLTAFSAAYVAVTAWSHQFAGGAAPELLGLLAAWAAVTALLAGLLRGPRPTWLLAAGAGLGQILVHLLVSGMPFAAQQTSMGIGMPAGMPMPTSAAGAWTWQMLCTHAVLAALGAAALAHGDHVLARTRNLWLSTLARIPALTATPVPVPEPVRVPVSSFVTVPSTSFLVLSSPRRGPPSVVDRHVPAGSGRVASS